ncbi:MAG TPA: TraR/DksA C4-type zinc finger protein [Candidatus Paceibacterota bacterium]
MNKKDIQYFKNKLEKEKRLLEDELGTIGKANSESPSGWEVTAGKIEVDSADENETADKMEEMEENELIFGQLEKQLSEIKYALERIEKGAYGICEISGKPIEKDRLEANPSARTCKQHMK